MKIVFFVSKLLETKNPTFSNKMSMGGCAVGDYENFHRFLIREGRRWAGEGSCQLFFVKTTRVLLKKISRKHYKPGKIENCQKRKFYFSPLSISRLNGE